MSGPPKKDLIGRVAKIEKGRDAGRYTVIVGQVDDSFCLVADGDKRKFQSPKKKNLNHLQLTSYVSPEVRNSILQTGIVTNGKLRHALKKYQSKCLAVEKGDERNCER